MQVGIEKIHYKLDEVNEYIQAIPTVGIAFLMLKINIEKS